MSEGHLPLATSVRADGAQVLPVPPSVAPEEYLTTAQWGMASFLLSEVAFFSTLIVAYLTFLGKDTVGPTPAEAPVTTAIPRSFITALLPAAPQIHGRDGGRAKQHKNRNQRQPDGHCGQPGGG